MDDVLTIVCSKLADSGIPYMLTGSLASSIHGVGRSTFDVDIVIDPTLQQLQGFLTTLSPEEFYVSSAAAAEALARRSQFNLIDLATSWKVDLIIRKNRPFSATEFNRRTESEYQGQRITIATPEDVILAKLEWSKKGGSLRQIEDAAGILRAQPKLV